MIWAVATQEICQEEKRKREEYNTSCQLTKTTLTTPIVLCLPPSQPEINLTPVQIFDLEHVSPESDHDKQEKSCQETVPLFKCPTVRYICMGYMIHNYQDRSGEWHSSIRSEPVSSRIERQESTIKGKQVRYFALLVNHGTI